MNQPVLLSAVPNSSPLNVPNKLSLFWRSCVWAEVPYLELGKATHRHATLAKTLTHNCRGSGGSLGTLLSSRGVGFITFKLVSADCLQLVNEPTSLQYNTLSSFANATAG